MAYRPRVLAVMAVVVVLAVSVSPRQVSAQFIFEVVPLLMCVEPPEEGTLFVVHFGYFNPNASTVEVPIGSLNLFLEPPLNRGQPARFEPGRHHNAFTVQWSSEFSSELHWFLYCGRGIEMVVGEPLTVAPGAIGVGTATCPSGKRAISGGFDITQRDTVRSRATSELLASHPDGLHWVIELHNAGRPGRDLEFEVHAVCAPDE